MSSAHWFQAYREDYEKPARLCPEFIQQQRDELRELAAFIIAGGVV